MTQTSPSRLQPLIDGASTAAQKIKKNVTRPFRQLAKTVSRPLKNRRAVQIFKSYDLALSQSTPSCRAAEVLDTQNRAIHAVYFCCHRDYEMLRMSLASLRQYGSSLISRIYIYEDASDPLSDVERRELLSTTTVSIFTGPRYTGWGADALVRGLTFYGKMLADMPAGRSTWLLKIDADVLFLGRRVFQELAACQDDLFGQPYTHPCGLTYSQGGCYAISSGFLEALLGTPLTEVMRKLSAKIKMPIFHLPEDACVFSLAERSSPRVRFLDFYLPAQRIPTFVPSSVESACAIHFETGGGRHLRQYMPRIAQCRMAA